MRYIADSNGYVKEVSFGATIVCEGRGCTEYTGLVPSGYSSLMDWFTRECETLYRWQIVGGNLTLAATAPEPEAAWKMFPGVEYRTDRMMFGAAIYQYIIDLGWVGSGSSTFTLEHIGAKTARAVNVRVFNNEHEDVTNNGNVKVGAGLSGSSFIISMNNAVAHGFLQCYVEYVYL